jgi:hypothetical protein
LWIPKHPVLPVRKYQNSQPLLETVSKHIYKKIMGEEFKSPAVGEILLSALYERFRPFKCKKTDDDYEFY